MAGKVAIITGAARGIGQGLFRRLSSEGCAIATTYHQDEQAAKILELEAENAGAPYLLKKLDVVSLDALPGFVAEVYELFGRMDYLLNNVGIDDFRSVYDLTLDGWKRSQDIILNAPFILMKAVLPLMRRQRFGRIVNIGASSDDYFEGVKGSAAFGVHKAALTVLTKTLAVEEIRNHITVNMVAPGSTANAGTLPEDK